jgi:preprotein translocase subunit YajC
MRFFLKSFSIALSFVSFALLAQDGPVAVSGAENAQAGGPVWINFVFIGGIILFMWLFVIRPQSKRAKQHRSFLSALTPGMEVVTSGGMVGKITETTDTLVTIDVGCGKIKVLRSAISSQLDSTAAQNASLQGKK